MGSKKLRLPIELFRPPAKAPAGKPLLAKPKPLPIITDYFYSRSSFVAEKKQGAVKRIRLQGAFDDSCQTINTFSEICRFHCQHYAHVGSYLDHTFPPQKDSAKD